MKLALKIVAALVLLIVIGLVSLRFLVPTDAIRERVASIVEQQTGRKLNVAGDASVGVFPSLGVFLNDVSLADPAEMGDGQTLHMDGLKVDVELAPLFSREVAIKRLILSKPTITLRTDKQGRKNWEIRRPENARSEAEPQPKAQPAAPKDGGSLGDFLGGLALNNARIENGAIRVIDERSGKDDTFDAVNLAVELPSIKDPLDIAGNIVWKGQKVDLKGRVASVEALLAEEATPVTLSLSANPFTADFEGNLKPGADLAIDGALTAKSPAFRDLLGWLGNEPKCAGFGAAELNARVDFKPNALNLDKLRVFLDGATGQGQAKVALGGPVPKVTLALGFDQIDLTPYMEPREERRSESRSFVFAQTAGDPLTDFIRKQDKKPEKKKSSAAPPKKTAQSKTAPAKTEAQKAPPIPGRKAPGSAPSVPVRTAPAPADAAPPPTDAAAPGPAEPADAALDASPPDQATAPTGPRTGLAAVDMDADIDIGQLTAKRVHVGKSKVAASLRNGVLDASLKDADFYEGKGKGAMRYDARAEVPRFKGDMTLAGVSALNLLEDAAEFDWLSGKGDMTLSVAGAGRTGEEIKSSLSGQGKLTMTDGAIEGVNLPQMFRSLKQGQLDLKGGQNQKTDFSQLDGTFRMDKGIASTNDLKLVGPLVRMSATGTIDLPANRIDMLAQPKVVANLEGQESVEDAAGLTVPLRIEGRLDRPRFTPDLKQMFSDPEQTKKTIKDIGQALKQKFKGKKGKDMLNSLLGNDRDRNDDERQRDDKDRAGHDGGVDQSQDSDEPPADGDDHPYDDAQPAPPSDQMQR